MADVEPLLATKLYRPRARPGRVFRPRLTARLEAASRGDSPGATHRLTLLSAPAGFGKTTLLAEWLEAGDRAVAWVSLDEGDNDPARFWRYVAEAIEGAAPGAGQVAAAMVRSAQPPDPQSLLAALVNGLDTCGQPLVLVLDDYHAIESPVIHQALAQLIERLPPRVHLVIATRADPPLPLHRLRARGELAELRAADLRFSPEETTAFLNGVMRLGLSAQDVAALDARTEGWIAGLHLAALSLQGRDDASAFIRAFSGDDRYVLDYLVGEVLSRQSPEVQRFLLQTSVLSRLSGPLCDAVTGDSDGQQRLEALEAANLFIMPLDSRRQWYRYHRLFADLVRGRLLRQASPQELAKLRRRAGEWLEREGLLAEAVEQALAAQDPSRAATLIERAAVPALLRGEIRTVLSWLRALPREVVARSPRLALDHAWALVLSGQLLEVEPSLAEAMRSLAEQPFAPGAPALEGEVLTIRAFLLRTRGEMAGAIVASRRALELLPREDLRTRGLASLNLGLGFWQTGQLAAAVPALEECAVLGEDMGDLNLTVIGVSMLGQVLETQGHVRQAVEAYSRALALAGEPPVPMAGLALVGLAGLRRELGDLEGALRLAERALALGRAGGHIETLGSAYSALTMVLQSQGDFAGAGEALDQAERLLAGQPVPHVTAQIASLRARLALARGDLMAAAGYLRAVIADEGEAGPTSPPQPDHLPIYVTKTRLLLAQARTGSSRAAGEALRLLGRLQPLAEAQGAIGSLIELLLLQALAHEAQRSESRALSALERALALAEPGGYLRLFLDEGAPLARLLRQLVAQSRGAAYARRLLAALEPPVEPRSAARAGGVTPPLHEPLSPREMEVLLLIARGASNQAIADELVISLFTVKKHVTNILGKLGAASRTEALALARELGLI